MLIRLLNLAKIRNVIPHGKQKEIAEMMNIRPLTLSRKLNGHIPLTLKEVNQIAIALSILEDKIISIEDFLNIEEVNSIQDVEDI